MMYLCNKIMYFNLLFYTILLIYCNNFANAGWASNCEVGNLTEVNWLMGDYGLKDPINDTHRGFVVSFTTENIKSMTVQDKKYLDARLENSNLIIFTTEAFENFEEEAQGSRITSIRIKFKFECTSGGDTLAMSLRVIDINNHDPVFTKEIYEYNLGMNIPEKFDLTEIFPISATDGDFTNYNIKFSLKEPSENFALQRSNKYSLKEHHIALKTATNLTSPFREEFLIVAEDEGKPTIKKTAKIIVTLDLIFNEATKKKIPYFSENLYYGNYTLNNQIQVDTISFKEIISNNISILQSDDYANNFKIYYDGILKEVKVDVIQPLSSKVLRDNNFITIQMKAHAEELDVTANTVLIIYIEKDNTETSTITNEKDQNSECVVNFSNSLSSFNVLPTIIYLIIILVFAFCTMMIILIYRKSKITNSESFQNFEKPKISDELYITIK